MGLLLGCGVVPPYSHSLDRLLDVLGKQGLDITTLQALSLKALTRMSSETRYPQDEEAPVDRFDAHDSDQALAMATRVVAFASAVLRGDGDSRPPR
jgi:HEPN domain-containing protein